VTCIRPADASSPATDIQPYFHKYSNWGAWALYRRYLVNQDKAFLLWLLDAFVRDHEAWEKEHGLDSSLFWQYDKNAITYMVTLCIQNVSTDSDFPYIEQEWKSIFYRKVKSLEEFCIVSVFNGRHQIASDII
jgi:hypothetical protein